MSKRGWEGWYTPTSHPWPESQGWIKGGYIRLCVSVSVFVGLCVRARVRASSVYANFH